MYHLLYLSRKTQLASPKIRKISRINTRFKHNIYLHKDDIPKSYFSANKEKLSPSHQKLRHKTSAKKEKYRAPPPSSSSTNFKPLQQYGCIPSKIKQAPSHHPRISSPRFTTSGTPTISKVQNKVRKQHNTLTNKQLKHKQPQNP